MSVKINYQYIRDEYINNNCANKNIKTVSDAINFFIDLGNYLTILDPKLPKYLLFQKEIGGIGGFNAYITDYNEKNKIDLIEFLKKNHKLLYNKEYSHLINIREKNISFIDYIISNTYINQELNFTTSLKENIIKSELITLNNNYFHNNIFNYYIINFNNKQELLSNNLTLFNKTKSIFDALTIVSKNNMSPTEQITLTDSIKNIMEYNIDDYYQINLPLQAILSGNIKAIAIMSALGLDINKQFSNTKFKPLLLGTLINSPELISIYINYFKNNKINVEKELNENFDDFYLYLKEKSAKKITGNNLLHIAILTNNINVLDILLKNGINVNQVNSIKEPPIFYACKSGNIKAIEKLINDKKINLSYTKNSYIASQFLPEDKSYDEIFEKMETIRLQNESKTNKIKKNISI